MVPPVADGSIPIAILAEMTPDPILFGPVLATRWVWFAMAARTGRNRQTMDVTFDVGMLGDLPTTRE